MSKLEPHPLAAAAPVPFPRSTRPENGTKVEIFDRRQRFLIATPTRGTVTEVYLQSLAALHRGPLVRYRNADGSVAMDTVFAGRLTVIGDSHVDRARNVVANQFMLRNEVDWILWIDDDIEFAPVHLARLFQHAMHGHKFVCGCYAMKCLEPRFVFNIAPGTPPPDKESGLIELSDGGTGFMLLHRDVFTALQSHPRVVPYQVADNSPMARQKHFPYFQSGPYGVADEKTGLQQWLSEDWMICRLWQELGGKVWGDTEIKLRHHGALTYPPPISELVNATAILLEHHNPGMAPHVARLTSALSGYKTPSFAEASEGRPLAA